MASVKAPTRIHLHTHPPTASFLKVIGASKQILERLPPPFGRKGGVSCFRNDSTNLRSLAGSHLPEVFGPNSAHTYPGGADIISTLSRGAVNSRSARGCPSASWHPRYRVACLFNWCLEIISAPFSATRPTFVQVSLRSC